MAIWNTIFANQTSEGTMGFLEMIIPVINIEGPSYFLVGHILYTPKAFQAASTLAERLLSAEDSATLKSWSGLNNGFLSRRACPYKLVFC